MLDDVLATVEDDATISGANDLTIDASGGHLLVTEAENGATATTGSAITPVISVDF